MIPEVDCTKVTKKGGLGLKAGEKLLCRFRSEPKKQKGVRKQMKTECWSCLLTAEMRRYGLETDRAAERTRKTGRQISESVGVIEDYSGTVVG